MGIILNSAQQKALRNLKIEELNEMQQAAIEHCRKSKDMVLLSPTGTGKTLAFLLPLLERLNVDKSHLLYALLVLGGGLRLCVSESQKSRPQSDSGSYYFSHFVKGFLSSCEL